MGFQNQPKKGKICRLCKDHLLITIYVQFGFNLEETLHIYFTNGKPSYMYSKLNLGFFVKKKSCKGQYKQHSSKISFKMVQLFQRR
jgi:hypothetical protein